jgi:hypothetical protein
MNGKAIICHDCHGFKWQNINIYQILIVFFCGLMPFLACWIVTAPIHSHMGTLMDFPKLYLANTAILF